MFEVLQTCIIGESFRACGVGYDPEDALETYHAAEFEDNVEEDDVKGSWSTPEQFLESLCSSNAGRVYDTIRAMQNCWEFNKRAQNAMFKILWYLGNAEALQYIDENFGQDVAQDFLEYGCELFDGGDNKQCPDASDLKNIL